jgi:hypothetical protein
MGWSTYNDGTEYHDETHIEVVLGIKCGPGIVEHMVDANYMYPDIAWHSNTILQPCQTLIATSTWSWKDIMLTWQTSRKYAAHSVSTFLDCTGSAKAIRVASSATP